MGKASQKKRLDTQLLINLKRVQALPFVCEDVGWITSDPWPPPFLNLLLTVLL